jgi:hypothetical protein
MNMTTATTEIVTIVLLVMTLSINSADGGHAAGQTSNEDTSENNIAFHTAELTVTIETPNGGEYQLEAFKSVHNDPVLNKIDRPVSQLSWVSIGHPTFIRTRDITATDRDDATSSTRIFHFTNAGLYAYIQMLTPVHRRLLAAKASSKYNANVTHDQIVNLILAHFQCSLTMKDEISGDSFIIVGNVSDFRSFPLRMDFKAPIHGIERKLFENLLAAEGGEDRADLRFACRMMTHGRRVKTNTLTIGSRQQEQVGLVDKLFGPTTATGGSTSVRQPETVYVTRNQLNDLAADMYSVLNIVEEYQMPTDVFTDDFISELLKEISIKHFTQVPVDATLETLSKYGLDFDADVRPDQIKRDLESLLVIQRQDNRARIILNETKYNDMQRRGTATVRRLGVERSADWAKKNGELPLAVENRSLADQLLELNAVSHSEVKWEIEAGSRVVPKTLNVARLSRAHLNHTLTFSRVQVQTTDAPFDRSITVYTRHVPRGSSPYPSVSSGHLTNNSSFHVGSTATVRSGDLDANSVARMVSDSIGRQLNGMATEVRNAIDTSVARAVQQLKADIERHGTAVSAGIASCRSTPANGSSTRTNLQTPTLIRRRRLVSGELHKLHIGEAREV